MGAMGVVNRVHHIDPWTGAAVDSAGRQVQNTIGSMQYGGSGGNCTETQVARTMAKNEQMDETDDGVGASKRLYSEKEVRTIVKCFWDYFQKGDLPTLREVRSRLSRTPHELTRGANSIRLKLKRLQSNGRWADYNNFGCT
ncbi:hypothetical protein Ciccas_008300 [Cichlidogyrus casuarinus]|uniref:Uncharacterized protein n=1 Tax=Cichlidogyrus casuarinus TaxID=1844966 RepID=A0ABD2Q0G4_9PLAT